MEKGRRLASVDYDLWEYALVALPDKETGAKILKEKQAFAAGYASNNCGPAHIPVAGFLAKEAMEGTLSRWIQNVCNLQHSFMVTLNNFSSFPPHTIYLRVQDPEPFQKLGNAMRILDGFIQSNDCPPLQLVTKPYLALASGLTEYVYENAITEYSQKIFYESFKVDRLILLRYDACKKYEMVNSFILPPPLTLFE